MTPSMWLAAARAPIVHRESVHLAVEPLRFSARACGWMGEWLVRPQLTGGSLFGRCLAELTQKPAEASGFAVTPCEARTESESLRRGKPFDAAQAWRACPPIDLKKPSLPTRDCAPLPPPRREKRPRQWICETSARVKRRLMSPLQPCATERQRQSSGLADEIACLAHVAPPDDDRREALEGLGADFPRLGDGPRDGLTIGTLPPALEDQWALTLSGEVASPQLLDRLVAAKVGAETFTRESQSGLSRQIETTAGAEAHIGARVSRDAGAPPSTAKFAETRARHGSPRFEPSNHQPSRLSMAATPLVETLPDREQAAAGRDGVVAPFPVSEPLPRQPLLPAHWTDASDPRLAARTIRGVRRDKAEDEAEDEARDLTQLAAQLKVILDEEARRHGIDV